MPCIECRRPLFTWELADGRCAWHRRDGCCETKAANLTMVRNRVEAVTASGFLMIGGRRAGKRTSAGRDR